MSPLIMYHEWGNQLGPILKWSGIVLFFLLFLDLLLIWHNWEKDTENKPK